MPKIFWHAKAAAPYLFIAVAASGLLTAAVSAQVAAPAMPAAPATVVPAQAVSGDKVALLHELALIESDTRLAMLLAQEGLVGAFASHATDPAEKVWPAVKDALLAAGVADFGPQLDALAGAADAKAVTAAGTDVLIAVAKARSALAPSEGELAASVLELTLTAANHLSPDGVSEAAAYQNAWSILGVARSETDLLLKSKDPALAKAAVEVVMALDDIILFMPDPATSGPVTFDPAIILKAADQIGTLFAVEA